MSLRILLLTYPPSMARDDVAQLKIDALAFEDRARAEGERLLVLVQPEGVQMSSDGPAPREGAVSASAAEATLREFTEHGVFG